MLMAVSSGTGSLLQRREFWRSGPDHRLLLGGVIPDFLTIRQWFDFRGVEIGRWVTRAEQELAAGYFFDALSDLCQILAGRVLNVQEQRVLGQQLVSLRGSLGLQYGTGGRPGVAAHYSPLQRTFSLAKNAGPGSIAHEWFHAFDHYIAAKMFDKGWLAAEPEFASRVWLHKRPQRPLIEHSLNHLLGECFRQIMLSPDGQQPSELFRASAVIDQHMQVSYYSKPEEMAARSFEAFVQDAAIRNAFLVKGTKQSDEARLGLYPQGQQRESVNAAFQAYFSALAQALIRAVYIEPESS
jgi:hypothetical protein